MSEIDNTQHRLVSYPSPDGDPNKQGALVDFPPPSELSEDAFRAACEQAWPQLLQEFVGKNYSSHEDHGYVDELVRHVLEGDTKQAQTRAQAWHDARHK